MKFLHKGYKSCKCKFEPRGDYGLEGFDYNNIYLYKEIKNNKKKYIRIYHEPLYYETCSFLTFKKYFKEIL